MELSIVGFFWCHGGPFVFMSLSSWLHIGVGVSIVSRVLIICVWWRWNDELRAEVKFIPPNICSIAVGLLLILGYGSVCLAACESASCMLDVISRPSKHNTDYLCPIFNTQQA